MSIDSQGQRESTRSELPLWQRVATGWGLWIVVALIVVIRATEQLSVRSTPSPLDVFVIVFGDPVFWLLVIGAGLVAYLVHRLATDR